MINISKTQDGDTLIVTLSGTLDEQTHFEKLIGPPPKALRVLCKGINRINSAGVKAWSLYFKACQKAKTLLTFAECSPAIVEQMNFISDFNAGGKIESIYIPYLCQSCKTELVGLLRAVDLPKLKAKMPTLKCSKCGGVATFDDDPEDYFTILEQHQGA